MKGQWMFVENDLDYARSGAVLQQGDESFLKNAGAGGGDPAAGMEILRVPAKGAGGPEGASILRVPAKCAGDPEGAIVTLSEQ